MELWQLKVALQFCRKLLSWRREASQWHNTDSMTRVVLTSKGKEALTICFTLFLRELNTPSLMLMGIDFIRFQSESAGEMLTTTNRSFSPSLPSEVICFLSSSAEWYCQLSGWMVIIHILGASTSSTILLLITSPMPSFLGSLCLILRRLMVLTATLFSLFLMAFIYPLLAMAYASSTNLWFSALGVFLPFFCSLTSGGTMRRLAVVKCCLLR